MLDLKPCPFCGGEAHFVRPGTHRQSCIVECGNCGCRLESSEEGELSGVSWNSRVPDGVAVDRHQVSCTKDADAPVVQVVEPRE